MSNPPQLPTYIYGLHDVGGQDLMVSPDRPGWVLDSVDLRSQAGADYSSLADAGIGVIVRLNHGYGRVGTIPPSTHYDSFAVHCADYVRNSPGAHIWIIGNETNSSAEQPALPDGTREVITPDKYARCFTLCRLAIKKLRGHADDWVIPAAIAPSSLDTKYASNPSGDPIQYLVDILNLLGKELDGLALHCYTQDLQSEQVSDDLMLEAPWEHRHQNFRVYRDILNALPSAYATLPVLVTEAGPLSAWKDANTGWIQSAYQEINAWNSEPLHQPIQALVLFRWQSMDGQTQWGMESKPALLDDFTGALKASYRIRPPVAEPPSIHPKEYHAQWVETFSIPNMIMIPHGTTTGRVVVKNVGAKTWSASGHNSVKLGYHWYDERGRETPVAPYGGNWSLPKDTPPGSTAIFDQVELRAPQRVGAYTLKWDLVEHGKTWFAARSSPTQDLALKVSAPEAVKLMHAAIAPEPVFQVSDDGEGWAALFLGHDTPVSMSAGQTTMVNLRIKNAGGNSWAQSGDHPVHVGFKWFDIAGEQLLDVDDRRTGLSADLHPGQDLAFGALLAAPRTPGTYHVRWDLVAEGITWFADAGNPPLVLPVSVSALPRDVGDWRAEASLYPHQVAYALDGKAATFWDSRTPQAPGQWFRVNLSAPRVIDGIQFLSPGKGMPAGYVVRVSSDGKSWIEAARVASENHDDVMAVFAPIPIQYVQIDLIAKPPSPTSWIISEIFVHLATAWSAGASHNNELAQRAIDNRAETAWTSIIPQEPGMWFQIDLGRVEVVRGLSLTPPVDENPAGFRVATWNAHGSRWQIAFEKSNNLGPVDIEFAATETQFINVQLLQPAKKPWAIRDVRVVRKLDTWLGPAN